MAIGAIWAGAVAARWWSSMPRLPLDVSASDPETLSILDRALAAHTFRHATAAIAVPLILALIYWATRGEPGRN